MSKELTKADCTEQQKKFLEALHDEEVLKAPARSRFRVCATIAGYGENTPIAVIIRPILHLIKEEAEMILTRAALSAAWAMTDIVDGENLETLKDRLRLDAAKQILDRVVPIKEKGTGSAGPQVVIMLPQKTAVKVIDHVEDET